MSRAVDHAIDPDEVAAGWFLRRREAGWRPEDDAALHAWLDAAPAHRESFERIAEAWEAAGQAAASDGVRRMRAEALAAPPERQALHRAPWARVAAVLAVVVLGVGAAWLTLRGQERAAVSAEQVYRTAVGERATVTLADGSSVLLNTASEVRIDYTPSGRNLVLASGEAWFDVAKDPGRPFVVTAGAHRVTAVGTSFDVRLESSGLRVAVSEGRVAVDTSQRRLSEVKAGERMDISGDTAVIRPNAGPVAGDWRDGRIEFASVSLAEAAAEMNRYRRTPIVLTDPAVGRLRVSGVFYAGDNSGFLDALPLTHPVSVHATAQEVRIAPRGVKKSSPNS